MTLVSWLSVSGVFDNQDPSDPDELILVASLVGFGATIAALAGLWRRSRIVAAAAVLAQAMSVVFLLLVWGTSEYRLGADDTEFVLLLLGVLVVDVLAVSAVVASERT